MAPEVEALFTGANQLQAPVTLWPGQVITDLPKFLKVARSRLEGHSEDTHAYRICLHRMQRLMEITQDRKEKADV